MLRKLTRDTAAVSLVTPYTSILHLTDSHNLVEIKDATIFQYYIPSKFTTSWYQTPLLRQLSLITDLSHLLLPTQQTTTEINIQSYHINFMVGRAAASTRFLEQPTPVVPQYLQSA